MMIQHVLLLLCVAVPPFDVADINEVSKLSCQPINAVAVPDSGHSGRQSLPGNPRESRY